MSLIRTATEARRLIGTRVYWNERDTVRYLGQERTGILHDVVGKNVLIDDNWLWRPALNHLRTSSTNTIKEEPQ